jgi:copper transporter 1
MMTPYLHFTGGDTLFLSIWAPTSRGEIAAACIGLFLMAIFERLIAAIRTSLDSHWHKRQGPPPEHPLH